MKLNGTLIFIFFTCFFALLFAFLPGLTTDYLRHDDWALACWETGPIWTHPLYGQSLGREIRPYTTVLLFYNDYFLNGIENAKFSKLLSIFLLSISSFLFYQWLQKFDYNKFWSLVAAIMLFTLPPMQIMASSQHYVFMVFPILLTTITAFFLWDANTLNTKNIKYVFPLTVFILFSTAVTLSVYLVFYAFVAYTVLQYFYLRFRVNPTEINTAIFMYYCSFLLFFTALTGYPMSAMFIWFLLVPPILQLAHLDNKKEIVSYCIKTTVLVFFVMIFYFIAAKLAYFVFDINTESLKRNVAIDLNPIKLITLAIEMLRRSSNLWDITEFYSHAPNFFRDYNNLIVITLIFMTGLWVYVKKINQTIFSHRKFYLIIFLSVLSLSILAYIPALVSSITSVMYRYTIAVTPLIGFVVFWSLTQIFEKLPLTNKIKQYSSKFFLIILAIGSILLSNYTIKNFIVKSNVYEMNYISSIANKEIIPNIKAGDKVTIKYIGGPAHYHAHLWSEDEFTLSTAAHSWKYIAILSTLLHKNKINTIEENCMPLYTDQEGAFFITSWGTVEVYNYPQSIEKGNMYKKYENDRILRKKQGVDMHLEHDYRITDSIFNDIKNRKTKTITVNMNDLKPMKPMKFLFWEN